MMWCFQELREPMRIEFYMRFASKWMLPRVKTMHFNWIIALTMYLIFFQFFTMSPWQVQPKHSSSSSFFKLQVWLLKICISSLTYHDLFFHLSCINVAVYFLWNHYINLHFLLVLVACVHTHAHPCVCGEEFCECDAFPTSAESGWWELMRCVFSSGLPTTKRCWGRGASEFVGVELLDILDADFFFNLQFNKTQLTLSLFCKSCLWDMSQWWHVLKLFQWKESLSEKRPLVLWETWPSMLL